MSKENTPADPAPLSVTTDVATDRVELPIEGWPTPAPVLYLWCMHVIGPDDVYAMASKEDAEKACADLNAFLDTLEITPATPYVRAEVALWPHSAASHAEDLARGDERYG